MMRYIVICKDESAFYSDMFDPEKPLVKKHQMRD